MGHHHHHHGHEHHHASTGNLKVAFFLNLGFTLIELIGGLLTNSLAILSDALHDLGDSLSLGLSWYFEKVSKRERDHAFSYGYLRFSLLGAIINSVVLIVGSIYIISEAIPRILQPEPTQSEGMFFLALLGIAVNGLAVLRLRKGSSHNERVVSLHLLEDVLGWVAVLIGSVVIYFTGWYQIDPILSLLIAAYVLLNVYRNIKSSLRIILQAVPEHIDVAAIEKELLQLSGVESFHDLHIWSMDGEQIIMTVHLVVKDECAIEQITALKKETRTKMEAAGIVHCTIEVECEDEHCQMLNCLEDDHHHHDLEQEDLQSSHI